MSVDLLAIVTAIVIFGAVFTFLIAVLGGGASAGSAMARQRLESFTRGAPELEVSVETPSFGKRILGPALRNATRLLGALLPRSLLSGVEKKLILAGEPMTMNGFLTMVLIATGVGLGMGVLVFFAMGAKISMITIIAFVAVSVIGFYMPFYIIGSRAKQRQNAIIKSLPDAFDLVTTCVEAGLGLDAALARVAEKVQGPFADELSRALRDIALGKARRDALKELGERTGVPDLIQFTNAVIQAEAMGSSVGTVLRVQAEQLRTRRRQRAEEQAYKAPVKMLFPLVLFIFPTLFIVILGPAAITIMNDFPSS